MNAPRQRFDDMPPAQQAGIICNDDRFQKFAAVRCGFPDLSFSSSASAQYLRECCQIASRRELNTNRKALAKFQILRTEFDAWRGKIAAQR